MNDPEVLFSFISPIIFITILILIIVYTSKKSHREPFQTDDGGLSIPVIQGSFVLRSMPNIPLGHNKITSKLVLYGDRFEYKIFVTKKVLYTDVENVDMKKFFGIPLLIVFIRNEKLGFSFRIAREENFLKALKYFKDKRCPLTPEAEEELVKKVD
jgi:hypothetical protein